MVEPTKQQRRNFLKAVKILGELGDSGFYIYMGDDSLFLLSSPPFGDGELEFLDSDTICEDFYHSKFGGGRI
jgi:hypothetical protein